MRCENKKCLLKYNCKRYLANYHYKIIIENPKITKCEFQLPLKKIA